MDTATTVDKETLTKGTQVTAAQAEIQHNAHACVTKRPVLDLEQDSLLLCLHCYQSFCSRSIDSTETH